MAGWQRLQTMDGPVPAGVCWRLQLNGNSCILNGGWCWKLQAEVVHRTPIIILLNNASSVKLKNVILLFKCICCGEMQRLQLVLLEADLSANYLCTMASWHNRIWQGTNARVQVYCMYCKTEGVMTGWRNTLRMGRASHGTSLLTFRDSNGGSSL